MRAGAAAPVPALSRTWCVHAAPPGAGGWLGDPRCRWRCRSRSPRGCSGRGAGRPRGGPGWAGQRGGERSGAASPRRGGGAGGWPQPGGAGGRAALGGAGLSPAADSGFSPQSPGGAGSAEGTGSSLPAAGRLQEERRRGAARRRPSRSSAVPGRAMGSPD